MTGEDARARVDALLDLARRAAASGAGPGPGGLATRPPAGPMRVAAGVVALTLLAGCGESSSDRTIQVGNDNVPIARLQQAATALCSARDEARGDVKRANTTFYDRSHDALHTIARALDPVDRALAAKLLEDKERVEADFRRNAPGPELAAHLDSLAQATRAGLAALSIGVPPCP